MFLRFFDVSGKRQERVVSALEKDKNASSLRICLDESSNSQYDVNQISFVFKY
jgi:hypothetical protein